MVGKAAFLGRAQGVCATVRTTSHSGMGRVQGALDLEILADLGQHRSDFNLNTAFSQGQLKGLVPR